MTPGSLGSQTLSTMSAFASLAWSLPRHLLWGLIWIYRTFISPALPPACRYYPSCSQYAAEAIVTHGAVKGTWLALRRLLRCHPYAAGGPDPVPPRAPRRSMSPYDGRPRRSLRSP